MRITQQSRIRGMREAAKTARAIDHVGFAEHLEWAADRLEGIDDLVAGLVWIAERNGLGRDPYVLAAKDWLNAD